MSEAHGNEKAKDAGDAEEAQPPKPRKPKDRPVPWKLCLPLAAAGPASLLIVPLASLAPAVVERVFSRGLYPLFAVGLHGSTGWIPLSLAEILLASFAAAGLVLAGRAGLQWIRKRRRPGNVLLRGVALGLAALGTFLALNALLWGVNYGRLPLYEQAAFDNAPPSAKELRSLCEALAAETRSVRREIREDEEGVMRLEGSPRDALGRARPGFERAGDDLAWLDADAVARPKGVLLSFLLTRLGVAGFFFPITGEPNVNLDLPASALPFTACHEMAHALGYASEDEANFVAYAACRAHPDADFRYAGALTALVYALGALRRADRRACEALLSDLDAGVKRDLRARRRFWNRHASAVSRASAGVNDLYLRSQGQAEGIASYGKMVDLLIAERRAP